MKIKVLDSKVSISDQITIADIDDIDVLADTGVDVIICNRPDNESAGQPNFDSIKAAAQSKGIRTVHIPFVSGGMTPNNISDFILELKGAQKLHAYCRTGNRSTQLWEAAGHHCATDAIGAKAASTRASARYNIVVVGAGSGGIAVVASLLKRCPSLRVALIDPADNHYYQPGWTMVGGGVFDANATSKPLKQLVPRGVEWLQQRVVSFDPDNSGVALDNDTMVYYDHLIVAPGLRLDWSAIEGLEDTLGRNGVTSNYRYDLAPYTWQLVQQFTRGKALFTQPPMPIKCAGAPQKALYLSADHWLRNRCLDDIDIHFLNAGPVLFGVAEYVPALMSYMEKYNVDLAFSHRLIKVDGDKKRAWFSHTDSDGGERVVEHEFDMMHVCPPQSSPEFIRNSSLSDEAGWLNVDQHTLQHKNFKNIWGLGDVINCPNAKTMAAARKQAPVVAENISRSIAKKPLAASYDGYGSCPLTVERGKIVLAEFAYGGKRVPTFPQWLNNDLEATKFAWALKANVLPTLYWQGMLKGREIFARPDTLVEVE